MAKDRAKKKRNVVKQNINMAKFDSLILSACVNLDRPYSRSVVKRLLRSHLQILISRQQSSSSYQTSIDFLVPPSLHSLLPLLLSTRFSSIAVMVLELIGAAALCSFQLNEIVASDREILKNLVRALSSKSRVVVRAACNTMLDISASSYGQEKLRNMSAIEKLLLSFYHVATVSDSSTTMQNPGNGSNVIWNEKFEEYSLMFLILDVIIVLVNTSTISCLDNLPKVLVGKCLPLLKGVWCKLQGMSLSSDCTNKKHYCSSNKHEHAAAIFRLTINQDDHETFRTREITTSLFGSNASFQNFILRHWEESPVLIRRDVVNSESDTTIWSISPFSAKTVGFILESLLQGIVSCPHIASDELDLMSFLDEINGSLGSSIAYRQDIRVLKSEEKTHGSVKEPTVEEVHFFGDNMVFDSSDLDLVQKCKEAFSSGYTIALRGMEFRSRKVSAIANMLAELFGQPSVGANIYITPPNSQGLSRHYDDHCVFVWQLSGRKQWNIQPRPKKFLPRLYDRLDTLHSFEGDACEGMRTLLEEGDIIYIPRGCSHEAHTSVSDPEFVNDPSAQLSMHLTLGIEVEPPFEWEGFVHVALHCWSEKQKAGTHGIDSLPGRSRLMYVNLLHASIRMVANYNSMFRKACMVAALPLAFDSEDYYTLISHQRVFFNYLIDKFNASANFLEIFQSVEMVVKEKHEGSFQWIRWLRHLHQEGDGNEVVDYDDPFGIFKDIVIFFKKHTEEAMIKYMEMKSYFCGDDIFEDACRRFRGLLDKYRKTRKQYTKGMLALHSIEW